MGRQVSASVVKKEITKLRKEWGWTPSELISLLRGGGSSGKGGDYERDICRTLSLWWTGQARDDVFWRSSGSGARAKIRGRAGRDTMGQHGDVAATDPIGAPLIDIFTIEIKRGYSEHTIQDILDRQEKGGMQEYENFFAQTVESYQQAGSYAWLLITRRDRRVPLVWWPMFVTAELRKVGAFLDRPIPIVSITTPVRNKQVQSEAQIGAHGTHLSVFLEAVKPEHILELSRRV